MPLNSISIGLQISFENYREWMQFFHESVGNTMARGVFFDNRFDKWNEKSDTAYKVFQSDVLN